METAALLKFEIDIKDYTSSEPVSKFLDSIENWIEAKQIEKIEISDEVNEILNMDSEDLSQLNQTELQTGSFVLYKYCHYLNSVLGKEKSVLDWCTESIWYIVCDKLNNYGDAYTKWDQKYYSAIKENPLARELLRLKIHCNGRVNRIKDSISSVERMANLLEQMSRRF